MLKREKTKKGARRYFSPVLVLIIAAAALLVVYEKTAQEPEAVDEVVESEAPTGFQQEIKFTAPPTELTGEMNNSQYYSATFSDTFSSLAWIDADLTTLHFDWTGTNFIFPPLIETKELAFGGALDNFVPEKVVGNEKEILFLGHHQTGGQKQILLWRPASSADGPAAPTPDFSKKDLAEIGFQKDIEIVEVQPQPTGWLVFAQKPEAGSMSVYHLSLVDNQLSATNHQSSIINHQLSDIQIACGSGDCLIYGLNSSGLPAQAGQGEFWNFNIQTSQVAPVGKLSNKIAEQKPEQVVIANHLSIINDQLSFIIGWAKDKKFEVLSYRGPTSVISALFSQNTEYDGKLGVLPLLNGRIFVLWSSYFTQAYEIDFPADPRSQQTGGRITDLSSRFGWRITNGGLPAQAGQSKLYQLASAIYIINNDGSIVRWSGEINNKIDQVFGLNFTPNFTEIIIRGQAPAEPVPSGYLIAGVPGGGTKIYQFTDSGFDLSAIRQAVSEKINFSVANLGLAQISGLEAGLPAQAGPGQSLMEYYLSNNGGQTWEKTDLGQMVKFAGPGDDLRWKIRILPLKDADSSQTPYLRSITIKYWYER